jgi:hypothetical protein
MARRPDPAHNGLSGFHAFRGEDGEGYGSFEVFWIDGDDETNEDGEPLEAGWYWAACFPGCLPDGDPSGPFNSSRAAWRDAREA